MEIAAVIFDLDGVLVDSEGAWNSARAEVASRYGGTWRDQAQREMMGMSSTEWSVYMHDRLGVRLAPQKISEIVAGQLADSYRRRLPLLPGACAAVKGLAARHRLALASSANRSIIDLVLDLASLTSCFAATVSSEEVARGKPAPDVYLEAARRISVAPAICAAVEDSSNGLRSAAAAGMAVIAVPNREFPPSDEALALADAVLESLEELTPELIERLGQAAGGRP